MQTHGVLGEWADDLEDDVTARTSQLAGEDTDGAAEGDAEDDLEKWGSKLTPKKGCAVSVVKKGGGASMSSSAPSPASAAKAAQAAKRKFKKVQVQCRGCRKTFAAEVFGPNNDFCPQQCGAWVCRIWAPFGCVHELSPT